MIYALSKDGQKIRATPGTCGYCDMCGKSLIAKCGEIVTAHWAHRGEDCDPWREAETEWHRYWKTLAPKEQVEVAIVKNGERHRADIVTRGGKVIELQHSALGVNKIRAREAFYTPMIWLFDVRAARPEPKYHPQYYGGRIPTNMTAIRLCLRQKEGYHTFRWYHPRKSVAYATAPTYLDVGRGEIFHLKKMGFNTPCGGWGVLKPKDAFVAWLRRSCARTD